MELVSGQGETYRNGQGRYWPVTAMWTCKDVHDYVCDIGYGKYSKCFRNSAINGREMANLTPYDLQRMGVKKMDDAVYLCASFQAVSNRLWRGTDDKPGEPPNVSYPSTTGGRDPTSYDPRLPPSLQHKTASVFDPRFPKLPGHPFDIDRHQLSFPFRKNSYAERIIGHLNPSSSNYHGHFMVIGRVGEDWKLHNSEF